MQSYTRSEILWLLSLTHDQAVELDAGIRDSCAGLHSSLEGTTATSAEGPSLPVTVRWNDVQRVRRDVIHEKETVAIIQLRAAGFAENSLARFTGGYRLAFRRRPQATVEEILDRLGGEQVEDRHFKPRQDACLRCGRGSRVRLSEVRVRVRGGWRVDQPARQASVCIDCLSPHLRSRVHQELHEAA